MDPLEGVSSLLEKSLLEQEEGAEGEPRLVMLETIRDYARERLEQSGEAVRRAHAEYFLALAEKAEPMLWGAEDGAWLDRLEQEHDNMRAALSWSLKHDEVELALRLGGALRWFWNLAGSFSEGRSWLEAALGKEGSASAEVRAKALAGVSWLASDQGDLERAEVAAEEVLKLNTEAGIGSEVAAEFKNLLGKLATIRGEHEQAARLGEEGLALYQEAGDKPGISWSLGNLAVLSAERGDYERAKQLYEEAIALSRQLGSVSLLAQDLGNLGYTLLLEGDLERATELNQEAADLYRKQGRRGGLNVILDNLGWAALLRGDYDKARDLHKDSLILSKDLGDREIASESLEGLACGAVTKGDPEGAVRLFGAAEELREAVGYQQVPEESALRELFLQAARSRLAEAAWEDAFMEGRTMGMGEAVEYALSKEEEIDPLTTPVQEQIPAGEPIVELTPRESEIAALVARGLTNHRIAQELSISEHTVANHVRKILKKLGLRSRAQISSS